MEMPAIAGIHAADVPDGRTRCKFRNKETFHGCRAHQTGIALPCAMQAEEAKRWLSISDSAEDISPGKLNARSFRDWIMDAVCQHP
jgi:hypothetical protein